MVPSSSLVYSVTYVHLVLEYTVLLTIPLVSFQFVQLLSLPISLKFRTKFKVYDPAFRQQQRLWFMILV